jgi:uncharacterized protein YecE (DUF72 family)
VVSFCRIESYAGGVGPVAEPPMNSVKTSARVHVGRAALEGGIARYGRVFNLLEIVGERGRHPKRPGLLEWRKSVPDGFAFSVVVPTDVASLTAGTREDELLTHAEGVVEALDAAWWVLRTPPQVTPSTRATRALAALVSRLGAAGRRIAWEPRGVWSDETALAAAGTLGVRLVRDLAREDRLDEDPVVYTRLRALGEGARIGAAAAERVAERLEGATEAFVVVEGTGAGRVRTVLREALGANASNLDDDVGHDDDEEDDEDQAEDSEMDGDTEEDE